MELIGKANLSFVPAAAIAVGVVRRADYLQSRLGKRPFGPQRLPRLQLDCAECLFFAIAADYQKKSLYLHLSGRCAVAAYPRRYILDESVFAFILCWKSGKFHLDRDRQLHSSPCLVYRAFCTVSIRVWSIVYLSKGLPEPPTR